LSPGEVGSFVHEFAPQRVVFGRGRVAELGDEVERLGVRRVLLISQNSTMTAAAAARRQLGERVVAHIEDARPHAPAGDVARAREVAVNAGADCILAIGGGTATGLAKGTILKVAASLIVVPTTYAGSEVTSIYGVTERGRKKTGRDPRVVPRVVVYDPELTTGLTPQVTGASGMNAIAHCVEALYSKDPGPLVSLMATEAIRSLARSLPRCAVSPRDDEARSVALYGAYLAGMVLSSAGMAIHHRICHVLGGTYDLPHAQVNAIVLPHAVAFNATAATEAVGRVAQALDQEQAAVALFDLARSMGVSMALAELGLDASALAEVAAIVVESDFYNPRPASRSDVESILEAAYEGRRPAD